MASVFAVTTATNDLEAATGSATAVFVVTNTTARPLRGIAKIKPLEKTQAEWLKIDGETERDFPAGGTHQFTVRFNKPNPPASPTAPPAAESFPFRFDAISAVNPDEDFTEGPVVTVKIPEQKVVQKKPFPWWIIPVAAVLLIVVGVVIWLVARNSGGGTEVPDMTTKTLADAQKELTEQGFKTEKVEEIAPDKALDVVFRQDPVGKVETDPEATTVKLIIPAATTVPLLKKSTLGEVISKLSARGLKIGTVRGDADAIKNGNLNEVQAQSPTENTPVAKGTEVNVSFPCVESAPTPLLKKCVSIKQGVAQQSVPVNEKVKKVLGIN